MTTLRYIGTHQPTGMLVDVEEKEVKRLLDSGEYGYLSNTISKEIVSKKLYPDKTWLEIKIYDWIKENNIPIDYIPSRDKKDDVLKKLKAGGWINDNSK